MYAGLTADCKTDLVNAKQAGHTEYGVWVEEKSGFRRMITVDIDLALAQIAEMESAEKTKGCNLCCYTEYPDTTLYPRDRSEFYAGRSRQVRVDDFDEDELNEVSYCPNCGRNLASPYTEGGIK